MTQFHLPGYTEIKKSKKTPEQKWYESFSKSFFHIQFCTVSFSVINQCCPGTHKKYRHCKITYTFNEICRNPISFTTEFPKNIIRMQHNHSKTRDHIQHTNISFFAVRHLYILLRFSGYAFLFFTLLNTCPTISTVVFSLLAKSTTP